jgi:hypothetical protein
MTNPDRAEEPPTDANPPRPVTGAAQRALHRGSHYPCSSGRRAISATCALHRGPMGFTNLLVTKRNGTIVLDPHVDGSCVIFLDQDGATALCDTLTEWLG